MHYPNFDPVAFSIGPLAVRWYALAYLAGIVLGWQWCMKMAKEVPPMVAGPRSEGFPVVAIRPELYDEFLTWAVFGVVLGGRIGYILFYNGSEYLQHPLEMLEVWHGGMSFHGGATGVIFAAWLFTRKHKVPFFKFTDLLACVTPIGLGLGRVANFINGELFGRVTDAPWGMVFPRGGDLPRHPSQLYEAFLEGVVLLSVMFFLSRQPKIRARAGFMSGTFLVLYGIARFTVEFFREPDAQLGFLFAGATMGQILCIPMILAGLIIIWWSGRSKKNERA